MLDTVRGLVRPVLTALLAFAVIAAFVKFTLYDTLPIEAKLALIAAVVEAFTFAFGVWFGQRSNQPPSNGAPH